MILCSCPVPVDNWSVYDHNRAISCSSPADNARVRSSKLSVSLVVGKRQGLTINPHEVLNGLPVKDVSANAVLDIIEPSYVSPEELWGATHAIVVTQPLTWGKLKGQVIATDVVPSGTRLGAGDTIIPPLFLGWKKGDLHYNANLAIFIPTADYSVHRAVNLGHNYWTFDTEFAATNSNPKTGWELTGVFGYSINSENTATRYTSGDVLHFDFAIGKVLKSGVKPGLLGYATTTTAASSLSFPPAHSFAAAIRLFAISSPVQSACPVSIAWMPSRSSIPLSVCASLMPSVKSTSFSPGSRCAVSSSYMQASVMPSGRSEIGRNSTSLVYGHRGSIGDRLQQMNFVLGELASLKCLHSRNSEHFSSCDQWHTEHLFRHCSYLTGIVCKRIVLSVAHVDGATLSRDFADKPFV